MRKYAADVQVDAVPIDCDCDILPLRRLLSAHTNGTPDEGQDCGERPNGRPPAGCLSHTLDWFKDACRACGVTLLVFVVPSLYDA